MPDSSLKAWFEGTSQSRSINVNLQSQRISELLDKIGSSDLYRKFPIDLVSRISAGNSLMYEITIFPSYGSPEIVEYDHAKDHPELEQVNMSMIMERSRRIPLFFEVYSGNIPDVVTLKRSVHAIKDPIPKVEIILDMGFFLHENLDLLKDDSYIIAASLVSKAGRNIFATASRTVDHADSVIIYNYDPICCIRVEFTMNDLNLKGYF